MRFVRQELTAPKSRAGRRTIPLGPVAADALEEQYRTSRHRADDSIVFSHPALGTPLDPSKLTTYARKALTRANVPASFRPWHGMRHTALTETAAPGVPGMFVQAKAGHAQGSTTERYCTRTGPPIRMRRPRGGPPVHPCGMEIRRNDRIIWRIDGMKHEKASTHLPAMRRGDSSRLVDEQARAGRRVGMMAPRHECGCLPGTKTGTA
jgi:hypothetical protein